jgi:hypothetical protein
MYTASIRVGKVRRGSQESPTDILHLLGSGSR